MTPKLSIIVPVYNEARTLHLIMQKLHDVFHEETQLIFVNDGSKDDSLAILQKHACSSDLVLTKANGGKGSAVRMGIPHAEGKWTAIQDADLEYEPSEILKLLAFAESHPDTVIFGSRFLQENPNIYKRNLWGNKTITAFLNILFKSHLTDSYTCFKLFPTRVLKDFPLTAQGFELEAELSAWPLKRGIPIYELPISYKPRRIEEGKKIRAKDALIGALTMLKIRGRRSL